MELDHIFLFVGGEARARALMADAGLKVNYSRNHAGQGTRNLCACLDDVFLELLWLDGSEISAESERISLGQRGRGQGSPIGVAWRGASNLDCEPYAAPFLLDGLTIPVARSSLDPAIPFFFGSPDGLRPAARTDNLAGERQRPDFATLGHCEVFVPNPEPVAELLTDLNSIAVYEGEPGLRMTLLDSDARPARSVDWTCAVAR